MLQNAAQRKTPTGQHQTKQERKKINVLKILKRVKIKIYDIIAERRDKVNFRGLLNFTPMTFDKDEPEIMRFFRPKLGFVLLSFFN